MKNEEIIEVLTDLAEEGDTREEALAFLRDVHGVNTENYDMGLILNEVRLRMNANRIENEKDVADYLAQQERELNDEDFVDDEPYYTFLVCLTAKERIGSLMEDTLSCSVEARSARDAVALAILKFQHEYDPDEGIDDPTQF